MSTGGKHKALHNKTDTFIENVINDLKNSFTQLNLILPEIPVTDTIGIAEVSQKIARLDSYIEELEIYADMLKTLRKANSKLVYLRIVENVVQYEKPITEKDEAFFMDDDVLLRELEEKNQQYDMGMDEKDKEEGLVTAMHLRELWNGFLTNEVKPKLWKDLNVLLKLSKKANLAL